MPARAPSLLPVETCRIPGMSFGGAILDFFDALEPPGGLPDGVEILWPYGNPETRRVMRAYYEGFYGDSEARVFLIGINPGRFGAGVTGICFTDPVRLAEDCGIAHDLSGGRELSSDFVYRMIAEYGGVGEFCSRFYLTALSPVGFVRDGKNLNYYDVKGLTERLDAWMADAMDRQLAAGADRRVAFSMGQGKNFEALTAFNDRHGFFDRVKPLPHPRWVLQYRRRRLDEFIGVYLDALRKERE